MSADGYFRSLQVFNHQMPGPAIIVYEGQQLIVHLKNDLLSDAVTIHWHGMHQRGTGWMDGVNFITQCPISGGQRFTYNFTVLNK